MNVQANCVGRSAKHLQRLALKAFASGVIVLFSLTSGAQELPLSVGTQPYPGEGSLFVAKAKDFYGKAGLKVDDRKMQSGRLTMDAMLAGSLNIATPVETGPMFAIANGSELVVLAQISFNAEEVKPLVRKDSGVTGPKDLVGKRLGYGAGSSNQYAMYNWLKMGGVPQDKVTLVNLQPPELVAALVSQTIDVGFTWEPFLSAAVQKSGGAVRVVEGQRLYSSRLLLVARTSWAKENVEAISRLLRSLIAAADWMKSNRAEAVRITAEQISMAPKELDAIFDRWQYDVELSDDLVKAFNDQFDWASEAKLLKPGTQKPDFKKYLFADPLVKIRPQAVKLSR